MKELAKMIPKSYKTMILVLTLVSIGLVIGGFFVPPLGAIDGSVITSCGILLGFGVLWLAVYALERGYDTTLKHGETEITITNGDEQIDSEI